MTRFLFIFLFFISSISFAEEVIWHFPTPISANAFVTKYHIKFSEEVHRKTGGKLKIVCHPGGSLYKAADIFRAVRTGQVAIGSAGLFLHSAEEPFFALSNLPFLARNMEEAVELLALSKPMLEDLLEKKNLKLIYSAIWNPSGLFSVKPLKTPADLSGMKIRSYDSTTARIAQLAGSIPTKTETSEIALAFSTSVIDGSFASGVTGVSQKLWDYIDYYYTINTGFPISSVIVNLDDWNKLDAETQSILLNIAADTENSIRSESISKDHFYNETMRKAGMKVLKPTNELLAHFDEIGEKIAAEWLLHAGKDGEAILRSIRSYD